VKRRMKSNMGVLNVTNTNFNEEVINSDKPVLIDFYADWCGPCKMIGPVVEELANENADIKVVKVNVDDNSQIAAKYQVMSIPTLIVIENGQVVNQSVGLISKSEILDLIK
jgi:thioredoxin 1